MPFALGLRREEPLRACSSKCPRMRCAFRATPSTFTECRSRSSTQSNTVHHQKSENGFGRSQRRRLCARPLCADDGDIEKLRRSHSLIDENDNGMCGDSKTTLNIYGDIFVKDAVSVTAAMTALNENERFRTTPQIYDECALRCKMRYRTCSL